MPATYCMPCSCPTHSKSGEKKEPNYDVPIKISILNVCTVNQKQTDKIHIIFYRQMFLSAFLQEFREDIPQIFIWSAS